MLVAGANFGCGSSREHAAWALEDYGFRAVIAPSFADIFRSNAVTNGLLPVVLPKRLVAAIADARTARDGYALAIDLEDRRVRDEDGIDESFDIDDAARHRLLNGLDDIGLILQHEEAIAQYERAVCGTKNEELRTRTDEELERTRSASSSFFVRRSSLAFFVPSFFVPFFVLRSSFLVLHGRPLLHCEAVEQPGAARATRLAWLQPFDACALFHDVGLAPPPCRSW